MHLTAPSHWSRSVGTGGRDASERVGAITGMRRQAQDKHSSFGPAIRGLAAAVADLQEKRHSADYDPLFKAIRSDALLTVEAARSAIGLFEAAPQEERALFLSLLLFPPKRN